MGHTVIIWQSRRSKDWEEAIRLCGQAIADAGYADKHLNACIEREKNIQTGLPSEVPVADSTW